MLIQNVKRLSILAILPVLSIGFVRLVHATEGCNAVGWGVDGEASFRDVQGCDLYYPAIHWLQVQGIVQGVGPEGTIKAYEPDRTINRAEFTKMTLLASGVQNPPPCTSAPFPDVPQTAWFAPYVCAAKTRGIIGGFPDGTFKPEININFANGAKILVKTFVVQTDEKDAQFDTDQNIWYRPYTLALLRKGVVAETINAFTKTLTRGEMAEMLYRLKTGRTSIVTPPKRSGEPMGESLDDLGMGYEMHKLEFGLGFYLSSEPDPPFIFTENEREMRLPSEQFASLKGYAFSHVLQHERCGESGLFEHCTPTFTDWSVGLYISSSSPNYLIQGLFEPERFTRYFGGKAGTCGREGIEGEYTETCVVPWTAEKTLVVTYDYIDTSFAYSDLPGITPTSASDAMYARIRQSIRFE